jgi:hypothetical protein
MPLALLVALFEEPAVAALRVTQDLPAIVVGIPEEEAIGAVLQPRLADLFESLFFGLFDDDTMRRVDLVLRADIEAVVIEQAHRVRLL